MKTVIRESRFVIRVGQERELYQLSVTTHNPPVASGWLLLGSNE
jgi:hypothetical protein